MGEQPANKRKRSKQIWRGEYFVGVDVVVLACRGKHDSITKMPESEERPYGSKGRPW